MGNAIEDECAQPVDKQQINGISVRVTQLRAGKDQLRRRQKWKQLAEAWYKKYILELVLRQVPLPPSKDGRHISLKVPNEKHLIDERTGHAYTSNVIRSSRYTLYDFLPKQLLFQATRLSNFYFICIGVPQTIPGLSTTGSYTTILPLLFFMLLTILKEGYDDYKRHRLDNVENTSQATLLSDGSAQRGETFRMMSWLLSHRLRSNTSPIITQDLDADGEEISLWSRIRWRDIRVGDILKLKRDDPVPADMVILYADGENGIAYVETMAVDGETNLKSRQAPSSLKDCSSVQGIRSCRAEFVLEDPNPNLYAFDGRVTVDEETLPLTLSEVLYRGSVLRNTSFVIGIVVNTGEECKIRMNANQHPHAKKPHLEKFSNQIVLTLVLYVILLSVGVSMGYLIWQRSTEQYSFYLENASVPFEEIIINFAIMFNNVIPLALYVTLEIIKIGQMLLLNSDIEMYDEASDTPMTCNTNTILENLGQVNYILSDKTGTLTENVMIFRKMTIAGTAWSHEESMGTIYRQISTANTPNSIAEKCAGAVPQSIHRVRVNRDEVFSSADENIVQHPSPEHSKESEADQLQQVATTANLVQFMRLNPESPLARGAQEFILGMALCHACLPEISDGRVNFQGPSPDEIALVQAAEDLGYLVVYRSSRLITLLVKERDGSERRESYDILDVIEFSSKRKRMSIVVRCPDGRIWLICKGADNVILPRLRQAHLAAQKADELQKSLDLEHELISRREQLEPRNSFGGRPSLTGQRTSSPKRSSCTIRPCEVANENLSPQYSHSPHERGSADNSELAAQRRLNTAHANQYSLSVIDATSITNDSTVFARSFRHVHDFATEGLRTLLFAHRFIAPQDYSDWKKSYQEAATSLTDRQDRMEAVGDVIEQFLDLLGASAIEDKLQQGVAETIDKLRRANIRIWMLTGDKRETAINIAHSAGLCQPASEVFVLDTLKDDLKGQILIASSRVQTGSLHSVAVIDGHTLSAVESDPILNQLFYSLVLSIDSVICCRASPAQKASIVKAIRSLVPKALTLAIGDGSNDIAMIQASHVGVGISGKEGRQASRVADYSIAQFRFLQRLLLVHGRWNYVRTAKFILMTFWKEMFFYMMQALYQRYNGYSGTSLYESTSLTVLNTLFTSLCVVVMGIFEQDLSAETLLAVPELYVYGQKNLGLNLRKYLAYMVGATAEGMIVWFTCWAAYGVFDMMGDPGLYAIGDLVFSVGIVWTNWKLFFIDTHHKSKIVFWAFSITFTGWWVWNAFLAGVVERTPSPYAVRDGFTMTFGRDPVWWLTIILVISTLAIFELAYKFVKTRRISVGRWPPWKRETRSREENVETWHLERWQEMEKDPFMRESLKNRADTKFRDAVAVGEDMKKGI